MRVYLGFPEVMHSAGDFDLTKTNLKIDLHVNEVISF